MSGAMAAAAETAASDGLKKGIAEFYDESSGLWENIWGDHMHHGYYDKGVSADISDHRSAQIRMVEEALRFAGVNSGGFYDSAPCYRTVVILGKDRTAVSFQVADALNQPFADGEFDLIWSMESGEHMPDKTKFVSELARVAAPGATIIIVTWCHRDLSPDEVSLKPEEKNLLNKICSAYYLPDWCSAADYVKIAQSLNLQDVMTADWSENVAPFWPAVIKSALTWRGFTSLMQCGWKTIRGAFAMPRMIEGYNKNLIKFAIITCRKPE
ncbi:uncharacterized protein A4U43_C04F10480 [Asparagus officinalis]|uniref:Methyltransferase type 11 domain-containing protein n=1 Tax=Asparagus officinalis TaxID=4686 RepID=A0A5P1F0A8_ASPOF|nr:uncharacterized protein A4U43_C04F10480 [Asparagus officinalis]